jgi:hypothetical protein
MISKTDPLERISRYITLGAFVLSLVVYLVAPIMALAWRRQPFPGFLVEPTLVVNDRDGENWSGRLAGLQSPLHVTRIAGVAVPTLMDFEEVIADRRFNEGVKVFAELPTGEVRLFYDVRMQPFPQADFRKLFWLPYAVGLIYLLIGLWVYIARGSTRPGRALAFFCASVALTTGLLFDVLTTHIGVPIWVLSVAFLGGSLISLALRFPVEWRVVERRPGLLALPYLGSVSLAGWAYFSLYVSKDPWLYLEARSGSYLYTAVAACFFFAVMVYRASRRSSTIARRQSRLVLFGSAVAFSPMVIWFVAPLVGKPLPFNSALFLPGLILFPLAVMIAILRYRLLEVDTLVNRAIVYAVLTAILAGFFTAFVGLSQRVFVAVTGERSDAAIVMTTLIVAAAVAPIRTRVQAWVDRQFRELPSKELRSFGDQVQSFVQLNDAELLTRRFLEEAVRALGAESGAAYFAENDCVRLIHASGPWRANAQLSVRLSSAGTEVGVVQLGPRRNGDRYRRHEVDALQEVADQVARAIQVSLTLRAIDRIERMSPSV